MRNDVYVFFVFENKYLCGFEHDPCIGRFVPCPAPYRALKSKIRTVP